MNPKAAETGIRRRAAALLGPLLLAALCLLPQAGGASRLDYLRLQPIAPARIMTHGARFDLGFEWEDDFRDSGGSGGFSDRDYSAIETLVAGMDGYVFHPLLLEVMGRVGLDLRQERDEPGSGRAGTVDSNSILYDLNLLLLQQKPVHAAIAVGSDVYQTNSSFFRSQRYRNDYQRVTLSYWNRLAPMDLSYSRLVSSSDGLAALGSTEEVYDYEVRNETKYAATQVHLAHETRDEEAGGLSVTTDTAHLSNVLRAKGRYFLVSQASWGNQRGSQTLRSARLGEEFTVRHTDHLETHYTYLFDKTRRGTFRRGGSGGTITLAQAQATGLDETVTYRAELTHRLYASVTTTLQVEKVKNRLDAGFQDVESGGFHVAYRKRLPLGRLALGYGITKLRNKQDFSGSTITVTGERHTFGESPEGGRVITLGHDLVDTDTISLADEDGFPLRDPVTGDEIQEGVHYRIETVGTLTRIRLLAPDGLFLVGQEVFVSYIFQPLPPIRIDTLARSWNVGWSVGNVWRMYLESMRSDQDLIEGLDLGRLDNIKDRRYGFQLRWGPSTTRAERENHRSLRTPYDTTRLSEVVTFDLGYDVHGNLLATYEKRRSAGVPASENRAVSARLSWRASDNLLWDGTATYRDSVIVGNDERELSVESNLSWQFRHSELQVIYRFRDLSQEITGNERHHYLFLRLRRYFGNQRV
ncbi:MAG: hypothetical protein D6739_02615 [Nitrospirae bacterium]|nr:MAG: hypothetical protein D6739_02615 [Nitrospirota bacterium]